MNKPKAVIVDLDGTLCNANHRMYLVKQQPKDMKKFFSDEMIFGDSPNEWCADLIHALYKTNEYEILFVTGRSNREVTLKWLKLHLQMRPEHIEANLYTRDPGDHRHDDVMKKELYHNLLEPHYRVMFAIDDRCAVTKLWRSLGIAALQCDDWEERDQASGGQIVQEIVDHFRNGKVSSEDVVS